MARPAYAPVKQLNRPNTIHFYPRDLQIQPHDVYEAVKCELDTTTTIRCIPELDTGWYNVTFKNEEHCLEIAGLRMNSVSVECEQVNLLHSIVVYVKVPYEMDNNVEVNTFMALIWDSLQHKKASASFRQRHQDGGKKSNDKKS